MEEESYRLMRILSIDEAKQISQGKTTIIITGVTGQDGSLMADYLLKNTPYELFGGARRLSVANHENIEHLTNENRFHCINFDLTDAHSIEKVVSQLKPAHFINFAAQSFVKSSWDFPAQTWDTNTKSIIHVLESIRLHAPNCRFYNAGSSEEFGDVVFSPQDESHPLRPRSPYGASKAAARQLVKVYRESYGLYAVQGWLFNHEGTRRGDEFVTRKITKAVARIQQEFKFGVKRIVPLELGNLNVKRDWSDAEDCVDAVWRMLNQDHYAWQWLPNNPEVIKSCKDTKSVSKHIKEYVVSSDENHTIKEFVEEAFLTAGFKGQWEGEGVNEKYIWNSLSYPDDVLVQVNPSFYRPAEVDALLGNSAQIRKDLGWIPKTSFKELVRKMVLKDLLQ